MNLYIVDAFTDRPYSGNPAAVCIMHKILSDVEMQSIANEMNLSETAFIFNQGDHYSLRWFTPEVEVDLCGHATLASAHILWSEGIHEGEEIYFETHSGTLTAKRDEEWIHLNFPLEKEHVCNVPVKLIEGLGTEVKYVGKNRLDYLVEVASEEIVKNIKPDFSLLKQVEARGVIVTSKSEHEEYDFVSRCFYPAAGVNEDPVTGSAHCCLGPYWQNKLNKSELTAVQLSARKGLLKLKILDNRIIISGRAVTTIRGEILTEKGAKRR
jgi:PhzF family phenazine biosynthesis protein